MPNWCTNELIITGPDNLLQDFRNEQTVPSVSGMSVEGTSVLSLAKALPVPPRIIARDKESRLLVERWQNKNWGTKWDLEDAIPDFTDKGELYFYFESAWSPPSAWVKYISKVYPELTFVLTFDEPGYDFAGKEVYRKGKFIKKESWEGKSKISLYCSVEDCDEWLDEEEEPASARESGLVGDYYCGEHKLEEAVKQVLDSDNSPSKKKDRK
jgi:hypothetical protein